jgi:hypothetical protein
MLEQPLHIDCIAALPTLDEPVSWLRFILTQLWLYAMPISFLCLCCFQKWIYSYPAHLITNIIGYINWFESFCICCSPDLYPA